MNSMYRSSALRIKVVQRPWRGMLFLGLSLAFAVAQIGYAEPPHNPNLQDRLLAIENQIAALTAELAAEKTARETAEAALQTALDLVQATLAPFTTVADGEGGYDVYLDSANLHIRNGLGATNGNPDSPGATSPGWTVVNGLGNLIVGYNEVVTPWQPDRTGSHNIVVGINHSYSSFGGFVAGEVNKVTGPYGSVSGGVGNTASGYMCSVSGGMYNTATGTYNSVSGGYGNTATGASEGGASVSGGRRNTADDYCNSVSGGEVNTASGGDRDAGANSVSGGYRNTAGGSYYRNCNSVSGGMNRTASGFYNWVAGGLFQDH